MNDTTVLTSEKNFWLEFSFLEPLPPAELEVHCDLKVSRVKENSIRILSIIS